MDASHSREELVEHFLELERLLHAQLATQARAARLTLPQVRTILHLYLVGDHTMGDIARLNSLSLPATTVLVDQLVKRNIAIRTTNEHNRRQVLIELTPEGIALAGEIYDEWRDLAGSVMATGASDLPTVARALSESVSGSKPDSSR